MSHSYSVKLRQGYPHYPTKLFLKTKIVIEQMTQYEVILKEQTFLSFVGTCTDADVDALSKTTLKYGEKEKTWFIFPLAWQLQAHLSKAC